ncbi:CDGSH iron-sulfur domain-containing protein [Thermus sp.]|uniref:CDGSH iron-sulfur domain-containing protein n=1 Tax=Thermus sp. TaxID=275 RepID=UPI0025E6377E|nr:CDGSH iron-sulfur domain-containing protein [Thermus sp.]MCS6869669.1 CDGSH iron-sulfur domain-containing protein [Thermus sp.]MCX7849722.1 CDGSH iron-sulfur domain-containing protein [Thermus sp.]
MRLRFRENGPYVLDLPQGTPFRWQGEERKREGPSWPFAALGHSREKPFCDGSHKEAGFQGEGGEVRGEG